MEESGKRSVIKSISWRIIASVTTSVVVFVLTGEFMLSLGAGFLDAIIKMFLYYIHERSWNKISWGREV